MNRPSNQPRAVVLLSGGLDSATVLAIARDAGRECHALSVDYGQRQRVELDAARRVANALAAASHQVVRVDLRAIGGSALTDDAIAVPKHTPAAPKPDPGASIPATYVPARNLILCSIACAHAETLGAGEVYVGVNAVDYSGYPDCRPAFIEAFERAANLATKAGVEGQALRVRAPLIELTKAQIIQRGVALGVEYAITHSCYDPDPTTGHACGRCDACILRRRGFEQAGVPDPTVYVS